MKIVQSLLTRNPCYQAGRKITVKGLMLHSVGCSQPKASVFINSWNNESFGSACVHAFIDGNDGIIYQTLPWDHRGWHCASGRNGSGNNTHIGVEMCEPACIRYTGGSSFTCSDMIEARAIAKRTYESAVELFAMLCKQYNLNPLADGVIISHSEGYARGIASDHGDPEHLWRGLGIGYTMDGFRKAVKAAMNSPSGLQASSLKNMTESQIIEKVGNLFTEDQKKSGVLASVSLAQFILESGYGKSELAQNANNGFGMKCNLSGNTWSGSTWDGSKYTKKTQEYENGQYVIVKADFRKYPSVEKSIADHSAYLLGAMNGGKKRYEGLKGCTDYRKAITIIKNGCYATSPTYIENICGIIEKWNLTKYDAANSADVPTESNVWYRVRKNWSDASSQIGAFHSLENAKACADENPGYSVFNQYGKKLYPEAFSPYKVRVNIDNLNIRKGAGTNYSTTGEFTGKGIFTIVEEKEGKGASKWGKLKSGAGWISLDFAERI